MFKLKKFIIMFVFIIAGVFHSQILFSVETDKGQIFWMLIIVILSRVPT